MQKKCIFQKSGKFPQKSKKKSKNDFFPEKEKHSNRKSLKKSQVNFSEKSFELSDKLSIFCFIKAILRILRRALVALNCFDIFVLKRLKGIGPNGAPLAPVQRYVDLTAFTNFQYLHILISETLMRVSNNAISAFEFHRLEESLVVRSLQFKIIFK